MKTARTEYECTFCGHKELDPGAEQFMELDATPINTRMPSKLSNMSGTYHMCISCVESFRGWMLQRRKEARGDGSGCTGAAGETRSTS